MNAEPLESPCRGQKFLRDMVRILWEKEREDFI